MGTQVAIAKKYATGIFFTRLSKIESGRSPRQRTPAAYFKALTRPRENERDISSYTLPQSWLCYGTKGESVHGFTGILESIYSYRRTGGLPFVPGTA